MTTPAHGRLQTHRGTIQWAFMPQCALMPTYQGIRIHPRRNAEWRAAARFIRDEPLHRDKRAAVACLALAVACIAVGCRDRDADAPEVTVSWQVRPHPPDTGRATVAVVLADTAGHPLQGAEVAVEGIMTHPGMAPVTAGASEVAPGRYEAELHFTMRGDWILLLEATLPDGRTLRRQEEIPAVGAR